MIQQMNEPRDLVQTQAEPAPAPHDVTVPTPPPESRATRGGQIDSEVLRQLKQLAERVGGLEKLKEVINLLTALPP